ncbi:uncharacterized protein LOC116853628 isoform X2 [Odontomachus brunneus]|uniref:uncharacterized protein LOC116853628 isoform X2 n=1 Tax=Odontomachus brunneus TaxID=486640 RepID=UPI0013F204CA|nr:uncharacterized protein LOC116853628 isoform X2 [Odontomachus brunneus]
MITVPLYIMPKVNRKYYKRAKQIADASVNSVEYISDASSVLSTDSSNILSVELQRHERVNTIDFNKELDETLSDPSDEENYNDNYELINNEEALYREENNDTDSYINDVSAVYHNVLDNVEYENGNVRFTSQLQGWAIRHRITHVALNELLEYIKPRYPEVPTDARTLLGTVRKVHTDNVEPGRYYHFGISNCVENLIQKSQHHFQNIQLIEIIINIDGLPLFKSSGSQVYPILCSLVTNYTNVGIIGIYHGYQKPADANHFLQNFVKEAQNLINHGITVNGIIYPFKIKAFICDLPAKCFIRYTKGHSGFYSCTKCEAKGKYFLNRVCFPYLDISNVRTDKNFRLKSQPDHHTAMEKPTWTIVKFSTDNTVEAVPSSWIEHNKCYWPPFKYEQIIAAIRKNMERNTCWPSYDIIMFRNSTYDDYNTARLKIKKAECTSDLNSEIDESIKRKRKKNPLYLSDTDDYDQYNSGCLKRKTMKIDKTVHNNIRKLVIESSEESEEADSILPKHPIMTESMYMKTNLNIHANGSQISTETSNTPTHDLRNNNNVRNESNLCKTLHSPTPDNCDNIKYFKEIIRQQSFFKTQLWQMADDLKEIKDTVITSIRTTQNMNGNQQQEARSIYSSFDLPLRTIENIEQAVEQFLHIQDNFDRSCTEACAIGGTSSYHFIKRNMDRLISNKIAQQYSWLGAKQKRKFCNLRIAMQAFTILIRLIQN